MIAGLIGLGAMGRAMAARLVDELTRRVESRNLFQGMGRMAHADRKTLGRSTRETERQQRHDMPDVPGASGSADDNSPDAAAERARKRLGKTEKHTSEDAPGE